jgi:hypothetical protein
MIEQKADKSAYSICKSSKMETEPYFLGMSIAIVMKMKERQ